MSANSSAAVELISTLNYIQEQVNIYTSILFYIFGVIGSVFNSIIFSQKQSRKSSCSMYFLASSITNILTLHMAFIPRFYSFINIDPSTYSLLFCKLKFYVFHSLIMLSRYYIVLACIDRYALCSIHVRYRQFSRSKVAYHLIPVTGLVWFIIPIHIILFQTIEHNRCTQIGFYTLFFSIYAVIFAAILPPLFMILFTLLILNNLKQTRKRIQPATTRTTGTNYLHIKQRDYQLIRMLWLQVIIYICSTLLYPPVTLYEAITDNVEKSNTIVAIEAFITELATGTLVYINVTFPFYIYLFISKTFRKEFKQIIIKYCLKFLFKNHFNHLITIASTPRIHDGMSLHLKQKTKSIR
ncbi:unnamed protein product [Didymodactylos carnosus]|uniref:G-protein coupled receptors family 1 profile domain-containing protein n=1 Tax=Didymodactylos carnosus TaxID=1234261 RepID=A0A8S2ERV8_9BILA|nr:unnamed protein product [Didymodactylos carnosus]CAF4045991.1 unnamed protein product [Didymodactylos carnosus]